MAKGKSFMKDWKKCIPELAVMLVSLLLCLCVWPLGIIGRADYHSDSAEKGITLSAPLSEGVIVQGSFIPDLSRAELTTIGIRFNTLQDVHIVDGTLEFSLTDSNGLSVYNASVDCTAIKNNDYEIFELDRPLVPGGHYTYSLSTSGCSDGAPRLCLGSTNVGPLEQTSLSMNGTPLGKWAILQLTYRDSLSLRKALVYDAVILAAAICVLLALRARRGGDAAGWGIFGSFRRVCIYACFLFLCTILILLSDESSLPLTMQGDTLNHEFGSSAYDYTSINAESGYSGPWASMNRYALNKGTYCVGVEYTSTEPGSTLSIIDNGKTIVEESLPVQETYLLIPFTLEKDCQDLQVIINYGGTGLFTAYELSLEPISHFYNDCYYYVFAFWLINALGILFLCYERKHPLERKTKATGILLLGIGLFSFLPYCNGSLPWGDDLCYHLLRIEGIKDGLRDGQFPVFIFPEGLHGYGYLNCMYPNLFLYIPAFIRLSGTSIAASYKTLVLLFHIVTAFITYGSMKSIYDNRKAAFAASLLYCLCPYRFTNFYARGAVGEELAMTFFPLLIAGLYHVLTGKKRNWWMLALGMSGLLQTHVLSAMLGGVICVLAGFVFFVKVIREKRIVQIGQAVLWVILANLWFLVPFLYYYKNAGFWLSALDYSNYRESSLLLSDLAGMINLEDYRTLTLGLPAVICAGMALFHLVMTHRAASPYGMDSSDRNGFSPVFLRFLLVLGIVCTILTIGQFNAWAFMEQPALDWFFSNLQFPWRLLGQATLFFLMAGCISLYESDFLRRHADMLLISLCVVCMLSTTHYKVDSFMYEVFTDTTSVGHESKLIGIPKGTVTIVYPYEWRREGLTDPILVSELVRTSDAEAVEIQSFTRTGTTSTLIYQASADDCLIEFPVQYYDGYIAHDENGDSVALVPSDNQLVSFTANGDGSAHTVTLEFHKKPIFTLAFIVSLITVLAGLLYCLNPKLFKRPPLKKKH